MGKRRLVAGRSFILAVADAIGLGLLWYEIFHLSSPDIAASFIGWKPSTFQFEIGMANIAFGFAGCVAFRASRGFKAATVGSRNLFAR